MPWNAIAEWRQKRALRQMLSDPRDFVQWDNLKNASVPIAQRRSVCLSRSVRESPTRLRSGHLLQSLAERSERTFRLCWTVTLHLKI
jgi:hypothetical protein